MSRVNHPYLGQKLRCVAMIQQIKSLPVPPPSAEWHSSQVLCRAGTHQRLCRERQMHWRHPALPFPPQLQRLSIVTAAVLI